MSMKIGENYPGCSTEYLEKVQSKAEPVKEMGNCVNDNFIPAPKDEYISSEKSGNKPSGLYRMGQDENGNPKILYDDPKKAETDENKVKELEKKLAQVEAELSQKNNDTYRRQNAVVI